jgi:hypothetical protein
MRRSLPLSTAFSAAAICGPNGCRSLRLRTPRRDHDHTHALEIREVLLEREIPISREEGVEELIRATKQLSIRDPGPSGLDHGLDLEIGEIASQRARNVLVEQHPLHATFFSSAWVA